ncbi:MAG: amino acid ABC transporter permease [Herbaspirillum sp.]|uniref:Amino acid ABC transporter permease n=1 Tax=Herbaspirillum huttiense subsp. lycopersici TaxID=3074428 RepID=A0ABU2EI12_9BURK|nr:MULTISPECIES: amino acid ABC transporter permease [Herbaspirillum]MDR9847781.1 amino acid ABC transporter permease [Herbaspirillum huttiense SE1]
MQLAVIVDNLPYLLWGNYPDGPLGGAALTVLLSAGSAVLSAILGLALGILLAVGQGPWHRLLVVVIGFLRAIPVLMLIFWTYFLLPIAFGIDVPGVLSVMFALSLVSGAYLAHAVAAGIAGIGSGQWQAGLSLGLPRWQVLAHIILPQALQIMLPSFVNQWVTLVKDSSLAYIVGVGELSFVAAQVNSRLMVYPAEVFLLVGLLYFLMCSALEQLALWVGRRFSAERRAARREAAQQGTALATSQAGANTAGA